MGFGGVLVSARGAYHRRALWLGRSSTMRLGLVSLGLGRPRVPGLRGTVGARVGGAVVSAVVASVVASVVVALVVASVVRLVGGVVRSVGSRSSWGRVATVGLGGVVGVVRVVVGLGRTPGLARTWLHHTRSRSPGDRVSVLVLWALRVAALAWLGVVALSSVWALSAVGGRGSAVAAGGVVGLGWAVALGRSLVVPVVSGFESLSTWCVEGE